MTITSPVLARSLVPWRSLFTLLTSPRPHTLSSSSPPHLAARCRTSPQGPPSLPKPPPAHPLIHPFIHPTCNNKPCPAWPWTRRRSPPMSTWLHGRATANQLAFEEEACRTSGGRSSASDDSLTVWRRGAFKARTESVAGERDWLGGLCTRAVIEPPRWRWH